MITEAETPARRRIIFLPAIILLVLWNSLYIVGLIVLRGDSALLVPFSNLMQLFGIGGAAAWYGAWRLRRNAADAEAGRARRVSASLLWLGVGSFALGQVAWSVYELVLHRPTPVPSWADAGFLSSYVWILLGVLSLPSRRHDRIARMRVMLDSVMILTAMIAFSWYFTLGPLLFYRSGELASRLLGLAYVLGDIVLIICTLLISSGDNDVDGSVVPLLMGGFGAIVVADSFFLNGLIHDTYQTGQYSDVFSPLGYMLIMLAAARLGRARTRSEPAPDRFGPGMFTRRSLIPYLLLPAVLALLVYTSSTPGDDLLQIGVMAASLLLVMLIVGRQIVMLNENKRLYGELHHAYRRLKQQNEANMVARSQLLHVIEAAPVSIALFDRHMRYMAHSQKWLDVHELPHESLLGRSHYDVFPDVLPRLVDIHRRALAGETVTVMEDHIPFGGAERVWRWAITPWYERSGVLGGVVLCTEPVDDLVRARESALETARVKSEFLAAMSHEIRTPMNAIIGMTELLSTTPLDAAQRDYVTTVLDSAQGLLHIIDDILDFSKIEAGKAQLADEPFDTRAIVEQVAALFAASARGKRLSLDVEIAPDVPAAVRGDAGKLRQVLLNLVGNAVKFTERGSVRVGVTCDHITPDAIALRFVVADTGIGIPEAACERLFQPFMQADGSITRRYGGTGLGLAISQRLVLLLGGEIAVRSTEGHGSTFSFTARFASAPAMPHLPVAPSVAPADVVPAGRHVLVVEDNPMNRKLALAQLHRYGYTADAVANGLEAVERLQQPHQYALVLMDCQMPVMDGYRATETIRRMESARGSRIPIIAMTADAIEGTREECLRAGMDAYITKPVRGETLQQVVNMWAMHNGRAS